jgi:acyl phosphate:glycerol-3-phosphate acyltransferase
MSLGVGLALIIGYALGSIPVALVLAEWHGVDLYEVGDGHPGAWNALEALGPRRAWPAFVGDGLTGLLAGLIGLWLGGVSVAYVAVAAAMLGHCLPMFADFKGGKAVMTFAGGAFALSPPAAFVAMLACGLTWFVFREFRWGARVGIFGFPVFQLFFDPVGQVIATGALMSIIGLRFLVARRRDRRGPASRQPSVARARPGL